MSDEEKATSDVAGGYTNSEPVATVEGFKCKTCGREFGNAIGLQTHEIRAHKKFWSTNKGQRRIKKPVDRRKKPRAALNPQYLKYRDRYRAQGLNAKGQPYKTGPYASGKPGRKPQHLGKTCPVCSRTFSTRPIMGHHLRAIHGKSLTEFRNGAEPVQLKAKNTTCPVCGRKYKRRAYLAIHAREEHGKPIQQLEAQQKLQQPTRDMQSEPKQPQPRQQQPGREIIFCPVCGTNIHAVRTAVNLADQH